MVNRIDKLKKVQHTLETLLNTSQKRIDAYLSQFHKVPENEKNILTQLKNVSQRLKHDLQQVNLNTTHQQPVNSFFAAKSTARIIRSFEDMSHALDKLSNSLRQLFAPGAVHHASSSNFSAGQKISPVSVQAFDPLKNHWPQVPVNTVTFDPLKGAWPEIPKKTLMSHSGSQVPLKALTFDPLKNHWPHVPTTPINTFNNKGNHSVIHHTAEPAIKKTMYDASFYKENTSNLRANQELLARAQSLLANKEKGITRHYKHEMNKLAHNLDKADRALERVDAASNALVGQRVDDDEVNELLEAEFSKQFPRVK